MRGVIVILFLVLLVVVVAVIAAVLAVIAKQPKPTQMEAMLRQHANYIALAAKASRKGEEGVCNVYTEAAADVWKQVESRQPSPVAFPPAIKRATRQGVTIDYDSRIPEHLLKRAAEARAKTANSQTQIPAHLLERSRARRPLT